MPPAPDTSMGERTAPVHGAAAGALPFEVLAEIAVGATARVDLCRVLPGHPRQGQLLAVKRLHPHIAEDPTFVNQFLDEVWMTAALKHPNVVEVAGWGNDAEGSYLAVELVQGVSLFRLMKTIFDTGEAFTERMVVYLGACITRGLAAAHALRAPNGELLNLVHRDLTPGNVLLGFNGEVKIADFGLAKAKQRLTKTLTGMRKGEPSYMAPEAARSDAIDARADLFGFGVMLFELFAGRRPWIGKSDIDLVQITLREPPADLRALRPKIDRELVNVVNRCLEKDPAARFQAAREITDRFDEWLHVHGYQEGNDEALSRFVRRNAMRQMRWFERAISGDMVQAPVGRDAPRVPTYTEHTGAPGRKSLADSDLPPPGAPGVPAASAIPATPGVPRVPSPPGVPGAPRPGGLPPPRPLSPTRGSTTPVDPRTLRAQAAVQKLKKLAPAVDPPRPRPRGRMPTLDEIDNDVTDVELRVAVQQQQGLPKILAAADDEEETGEEVPTLIQKGDAALLAMRAEARKADTARRGAGPRPGPRPPYVSPGPIVDEESDQRITEVKKEEQRRAAAGGVISIVDQDSELPTEPIKQKQRHAEVPVPAAGQRGRPATRPPNAPTPGAEARPLVIPPSPDIPQRPLFPPPDVPQRTFPSQQKTALGLAPSPVAPQSSYPAPAEQAIPAVPPPPAVPIAPAPGSAYPPPPYVDAKGTGGAGGSPTRPPEASMPPSAIDPARVSSPDDVQVIDRRVLRQQVLHTEEGLIAESDRMAIEAVRRTEEARAAQLRAERKAAAAKMAAEAARIAAEAVQLIRSAGVIAAAKRMDDAHALEQALTAGRFGTTPSDGRGGAFTAPSELSAVTAAPIDPAAHRASPSSFPEAPRAISFSSGFPGVDAQRVMAITGASPPGSIPPPGPTSVIPPLYDMPHGAHASAPPSGTAPLPILSATPVSLPAPVLPVSSPAPAAGAPGSAGSASASGVQPRFPPTLPSVIAPPPVDMDAFRNGLKPTVFGLPMGVVAGLAVGAVFLVIVLALMLAR